MCEYLKRMSPQGTPTDDIRLWSGLTHSVVEYTGPRPFGMDGSVCLWLHERSATQLLDMCDELDAKFSDLMSENAKLRKENKRLRTVAVRYYTWLLHSDDVLGQIMARKKLHEMGIEVD